MDLIFTSIQSISSDPVTVLNFRFSLAFLTVPHRLLDALLRAGFLKGVFFPPSLSANREFPARIFQGYFAFLCCFMSGLVAFQSLIVPRVCDYSLI